MFFLFLMKIYQLRQYFGAKQLYKSVLIYACLNILHLGGAVLHCAGLYYAGLAAASFMTFWLGIN